MADRTMHKESAIPHHSSEWLVAHELAHQWFGDLLTTRNWANIWLNEGITSFMELIWAEHKYGYSEKEYYRLKELRATIHASHGKKPMVFFNYENSNDLFDANVYAKGAVVMNMLRNYIGEKPFQKAIQFYTKENAYKNVESYDLKKAFEETTGKNLYWFFDQWVYKPGLPELTVNHRFDKSKGGTSITVEQTQDTSFSSMFRLPLTILIDDGKMNRFHVDITNRIQEFFFESLKPKMVVFDEGYQIPKIIKHKNSDEELTYQLLNAPHVNDRISAAKEMGKKKNGRRFIKALFHSLSSDEFWGMRKESASALSKMKLKGKKTQIINLYHQESDARVKSEILNLLDDLKGDELTSFLTEVILNEKNDYVVRSAVHSLSKVNEETLMKNIEYILNRDSHNDIVRKAGISKLSSIKSDSNFLKLMELASYGGTTWNSRTTAVRGLESYIKDHPKILDEMVQFLMDPNYRVRWIAVNTLCKYGGETELDQMMDIVSNDPLTQFEYSSGKHHLKKRMEKPKSYPEAKRTPKKVLTKYFNELDKISKE